MSGVGENVEVVVGIGVCVVSASGAMKGLVAEREVK